MKVIWKEPATRRLIGIYRFVAENSPSAALRIYDEIIDRADQLADHPEMASRELSLEGEPEDFRSLVVDGTYKVIYYIESEAVNIIDVWDCRQSPSRLRRGLLKK